MSANKCYLGWKSTFKSFKYRWIPNIVHLHNHMSRSNISKLSHTFLVISFGRANWWVILYSIYNLFLFMFIIFRFKPACYKYQGIVPVLYLPFTSLFLNITRSPPNWALLYSSGHSIPFMAASQNSQNSSGTIVPDKLLNFQKPKIKIKRPPKVPKNQKHI